MISVKVVRSAYVQGLKTGEELKIHTLYSGLYEAIYIVRRGKKNSLR